MSTTKKIHINQHNIRHNKHHPEDLEPVITIKTPTGNHYAYEALIDGPCKIIYNPDKPLPCGAKVWIETSSNAILKDIENVEFLNV